MTGLMFLLVLFFVTLTSVKISSGKFVDCSEDTMVLGTVDATYDPSSSVDSILASCKDFSNSTKMALGSGKQLTHVKYDHDYQLVYWADWDTNTVRRGLAGTDPCFSEVIIEGIKGGIIELDPINRKLYWATKYLDGSVESGIGTSDLDGSNLSILYDINNGAQDVGDIRVDPIERLIFWGTSTSVGMIVKGPIEGGNHTILHSNVQVQCIEISPKEKRVYWLTFLSQGSSPATLQSANYDGSDKDTSFTTINVNLMTTDMVLYDGNFYVTTISFESSDIISAVYQVENIKGAQAVALELEQPYSYLTVDLGSIAPIESIISLDDNEYYADEGDNLTVLIQRTGNMFHCSSAKIETESGSGVKNKDFKHLQTTIQFQPHSTNKTVEIEVLPDEEVENQETFVIILSNPVNGRLGNNDIATIYIKDTHTKFTWLVSAFSKETTKEEQGRSLSEKKAQFYVLEDIGVPGETL
ncbi:uncharacterized protein [Amphiura filiformis]|uniref:uncharacterized protein n=1 Tax=Amphiura filiformis TaxID=82378 RepID=UPI003B21E262